VTLGAKEGPGSGYPCELEVQVDRETLDGSIGSGQIADGSVTVLKLGPGAAAANLADGSVALSKLAVSSLTINTGAGLTGGGVVALGGTLTLDLGADLTLAGTTTGKFAGDGSGLTNVAIPNIADGAVTSAKLANDLTLGGTTTGTFSGSLLLPAGTATKEPLRVQTGVNLTTPVFGAVEFDGANLYLTTNSANPTRRTLAFTDSTIIGTQIATGAVGSTQLASGLTLGGTTIGTFSGTLAGNATTASTATNFTGSLAGHVTGTQSATVVASVGGVTAANVAAGANLANAATNLNTASALVKRDGSGNFTAGTITLTGSLVLPSSSATAGVILRGSTRMMHSFGTDNFFAAANAGNFTLTGTGNTAIGVNALSSHVDGFANTAVGGDALFSNTSGERNAAMGFSALGGNTTGGMNAALGEYALYKNQSGMRNVALGSGALFSNVSGSNNIAVGKDAGNNLLGDSNIAIGNGGAASDVGTIRIGGGSQTRAFIGGIRGITTGQNNAVAVVIDSTGQLGTISSSRRYKEEITDMGDASARLQALRPVTFRYKQPYANGEKPLQYGLIAEEVAEVFPELAVFNDDGQPETVKYQDLAPLLLNEVQKLRADKDALQKESAALRTRLEKLEAAVEQLVK
jgi:hypothetical protein